MNDSLITVSQNLSENINLINQVNEFYEQAWAKLVLTGTMVAAIVGILVPGIIQWYQKKTMNIRESELEKKFQVYGDSLMNKIRNDFQVELESNIIKLRSENLENSKKMVEIAKAYSIFNQGSMEFVNKWYNDAINSYGDAVESFINTDSTEMVHLSASSITLSLQKLIESKIPLTDEISKRIDDLHKKIEKSSYKDQLHTFKYECDRIRNELKKTTSNSSPAPK